MKLSSPTIRWDPALKIARGRASPVGDSAAYRLRDGKSPGFASGGFCAHEDVGPRPAPARARGMGAEEERGGGFDLAAAADTKPPGRRERRGDTEKGQRRLRG